MAPNVRAEATPQQITAGSPGTTGHHEGAAGTARPNEHEN
jgi:hypothetical protein